MASKPYLARTNGNPVTTKTALNASTAVAVSAASALKARTTIRNLDTSITVYVGGSGVTIANGFPLLAGTVLGESFTFAGSGTVYAIAASGTPSVVALDEMDEA